MTTPQIKYPIAINHPDYTFAKDKWTRCRDACGGSDTIKAAGTRYLPALSVHKKGPEGTVRYEAYKSRALFYNAARRTRIGLSGAATLRPVKITSSTDMGRAYAKRIAMTARKVVDELLEVGRVCVTVNVDKNGKPTFSLWWAESIVNWAFSIGEDSQNILEMLVLEDEEEKFESIYVRKKTTVRHSYQRTPDNRCIYTKWTKSDKDESWAQAVLDGDQTEIILTAPGGRPFEGIPAIIVDPMDINEDYICDPVLLDLVDVNISHYHNSADLEHGRHWTALPTAVATGFPMVGTDGNPVEFNIGGESAWITDQTGGSAFYLEFSGSGLGHLAQGMSDKQGMMAILGARLLEDAKPSVEAAETIKTRLTGEKSVLGRIGSNVSTALTWTLNMMLWVSVPGHEPDEEDHIVALDTNFVDKAIDSAQLSALTSALQAGGISYETYFERLQNAEIIPEGRTVEEERQLIDKGNPGVKPSPFLGGGGFGG